MKRSRASLLAVSAAAVSLALAGCGGGGDTGTENTAGGGDTAAMQKITVGVIPIVDTAPIWLGKSKGFFEDEGLDLTIETTSGGAAAVPGVTSGSFDFAFGNVMSVMVAQDQGLDLRYVANGNSASDLPDKGFSAVVVKDDSPIKAPKDLADKTVSVNNLKNIGDTTIRKVVDDDGGDESSIKFVEIGFQDAEAALENGQVDAAWILEPFLSSALENGNRVISYNFKDTDPNLDIAGYFTTAQNIQDKPDLIKKFQTAMNKSLEYAQDNPDEVRDIVGTYTKIDEATRAKMVLPTYRVDFNRPAMEKLAAAAVKYGTLSKEPDLDKMLPAQ